MRHGPAVITRDSVTCYLWAIATHVHEGCLGNCSFLISRLHQHFLTIVSHVKKHREREKASRCNCQRPGSCPHTAPFIRKKAGLLLVLQTPPFLRTEHSRHALVRQEPGHDLVSGNLHPTSMRGQRRETGAGLVNVAAHKQREGSQLRHTQSTSHQTTQEPALPPQGQVREMQLTRHPGSMMADTIQCSCGWVTHLPSPQHRILEETCRNTGACG